MGKRKQRPTEPEAEPAAAAEAGEGEQEVDEQDGLTGGGSSDSGGSEDVDSGSGSDDSGSEGGEDDDSEDSSSDDDGSSSSGPEVSDEEDGKEGSDDPDAFDKIDVNFEFFDPKESDFHGLKALLHSYLDGQQYDSSALIDAIIQQSQVGTVVRTGEDEDPIAVMTVLNTQQHSNSSGSTAAAGGGGKAGSSSSKKEGQTGEAGGGFMHQIKQHMMSHCKDAATKQQLNKAWEQPSTGLIINERLINSPPQLAPPLVQALFSEIAWATEDEPTQARRDAFKFKQYLLMTRVFSDPLPQQQQQQGGAAAAAGGAAGGPSSSSKGGGKPPAGGGRLLPPKGPQQPAAKKQKQQHGGGAQANAPVIVYVRPEDEFFHKHATASFTFPIEGRAVGKDELQPLRLVMLLPANKVAAARTALDAVVGNMAAQQL